MVESLPFTDAHVGNFYVENMYLRYLHKGFFRKRLNLQHTALV